MESQSEAIRVRIIPELDGVRGIAILLVLLFHFGQPPPGIPRFISFPLMLGWSGVDLFFVLSGFLISGILLETKKASNYFQSFYARRALRILPVYFLTIFVYFHIAKPLAHHIGYWLPDIDAPEIWYWLHVSNWRSAFQTQPAHDVTLLTHVWSLSIEEQFYFAWPFLILFLDPVRLLFASSAMVLVPLCLRFAYLHNQFGAEFLYRLTPFRIDSLAMGCLIAVIMRNAKWRAAVAPWIRYVAAGSAIVIFVCLLVQRSPSNVGPAMESAGYTCFAFLYATVVWVAAAGSPTWLCAELRRRSLRAFGKYSYAIYIFHLPIAEYLNRATSKVAIHFSVPLKVVLWLCSIAIGVSLSFAVAIVSWNLIEKRFLALKDRFAARFSDVKLA
jgi:peptidoglycan/LPS O-acetylase OafA/YrhL